MTNNPENGKATGRPDDGHEEKPWEVIARAITQEPDSARVLQLCKDLSKALDKENAKSHPRIEAVSQGTVPRSTPPGEDEFLTDSSDGAGARWQRAYQAALLEKDKTKLLKKAEHAETLIFRRLQALGEASRHCEEAIALDNAIRGLRTLQRDKLKFPEW